MKYFKHIFICILILMTITMIGCSKDVEESYAPAEGVQPTTESNIEQVQDIATSMDEFQEIFSKIKDKVSEEYPVITTANLDNYLKTIERECSTLKNKHIIKDYERIDKSVFIQINDDASYIFEAPTED